MGFENYHEPPDELPKETRTFARMMASLTEECEAINWYEQRISVEKDKEARAIMTNAQHEEFKHFGMNLEFLLRKKPKWPEVVKAILFTEGAFVERGAGGGGGGGRRGGSRKSTATWGLVKNWYLIERQPRSWSQRTGAAAPSAGSTRVR